ncbi:hypothetical protein [Ammoniphilus sp. YIM 78166]|uniref:hypothetical protein n=1 Tax=Ammoniphilus sp. YIM 78166 TaxID=1644106 RepID=UPI00106F9599|nr:hypothetical protein [Ammoniphilus sp. YIM 78166]
MESEQIKKLDEIGKLYEKASKLTIDYWQSYSSFNTWQFWFLLSLLVLPLVALYFFLDRKKAFHIGFYGYSVHMLFHYIDTYFYTNRLANYPYKVIPFLPTSLTLDTAFIPVSFMLLYQWTLNKNKNYYLYATGLCLFLSFLFKPALVAYGLFKMYKWVNYFHLFLGYLTVALLSKWITNVFLYFQKEAQASEPRDEVKAPRERRFFLSRLFSFRKKAR